MCPDKETLSAFIDNEVEGKFKAALADHLEKCPGCAGEVARMKSVSLSLKDDGIIDEQQLEKSRTAVWQRIESERARNTGKDFWHRSVAVPVPLMAAAALVLFVFTVTTLFGLFMLSDNASQRHMKYSETLTINQDDDFNLFERDQVLEVDLQLPENTVFMISGTPTLIREVDYINTGK